MPQALATHAVVVDETADLARAAQSIVKGASFDNNIICADEKVLIVVDSVADELMRLMEGQHAVKLTAEQAQQLQYGVAEKYRRARKRHRQP